MGQLKSTSITGDLSVSGKITGTFGGLTASRALVTNSSGNVAVSAVTSTELGYLDGVTSAIQTQLDGKATSSHTHDYIKYQDTRAVNVSPNDMPQGLSVHLKTNGTDGLTDGGTYHPSFMIKDWSDYSGGPFGQLSITANNNLWFRSSSSETGWNSWKKVSLDGHTHGSLTDRTNGTTSYLNYGASAVTSASYLAAWNGYELRAIAPATVRTVIGAQASGSYAAASHGNHVPTTQTASNKVFLRNDNTWQTVTPSNIGLKYTNILANGSSSSSISWSSGAYDFIVGISRPNASNTPCQFVIPVGFTGDVQIADDATYSIFTISATSMSYKSGNNAKIICAWGVNVV